MDDNTDIEINLNDDDLDVEVNRESIIYTEVSEERLEEIEGNITNLEKVVGIDIDTFSSSSTYAVGNTVVYNKKVYKCTTAVTTAGPWNSNNWTEVSVKELLDEINDEIDDLKEDVAELEEDVQDHEERIQQLETDKAMLEDLIPTDTAEGETIDISDSAKYYFKEVTPEGQTSQVSTEGKQLIPYFNTITKNSVRFQSTNKGILVSGTPTSNTSITLFNDNVEAGIYTISHVEGGANNSYQVVVYINDTVRGYITSSDGHYELAENDLLKLELYVYTAHGAFNNVLLPYMLEKGSTANSYEPYTGGIPGPNPSYPFPINNVTGDNTIKVENRNLLNRATCLKNKGLAWNTGGIVSITGQMASDYIEINPNTYYTMTYYAAIFFFDEGKTYLGVLQEDNTIQKNVTDLRAKTFHIPNNNKIKYMRLVFRNDWNENIDISSVNIQVEQGSTANPPYIPHEEQTVTFPLATGQYMAEGDYLADDGIHHVIGKVELDGVTTGKNVSAVNLHSSSGLYYCRCNNVFNDGKTTSAANIENLLCTHFQANTTVAINHCYRTGSGSIFVFILPDQTITTEEAANTWLAQQLSNGTPIKVQYPLATENIEPYTEAQQTAWNNIKKLMSYKGVTHISQTNDGEPFNLKIVYRVDPSLELDTIKQAIISLGGNV